MIEFQQGLSLSTRTPTWESLVLTDQVFIVFLWYDDEDRIVIYNCMQQIILLISKNELFPFDKVCYISIVAQQRMT